MFRNNGVALVSPMYVCMGDENFTGYLNTKSITVQNGSFSKRIKLDHVRVSRESYWNMGHYDLQFDARDINCSLCGQYGSTYSGCGCKESFSFEEHKENINKINNNHVPTNNNRPKPKNV